MCWRSVLKKPDGFSNTLHGLSQTSPTHLVPVTQVPSSLLLHFALAEKFELKGDVAEAKKVLPTSR